MDIYQTVCVWNQGGLGTRQDSADRLSSAGHTDRAGHWRADLYRDPCIDHYRDPVSSFRKILTTESREGSCVTGNSRNFSANISICEKFILCIFIHQVKIVSAYLTEEEREYVYEE